MAHAPTHRVDARISAALRRAAAEGLIREPGRWAGRLKPPARPGDAPATDRTPVAEPTE